LDLPATRERKGEVVMKCPSCNQVMLPGVDLCQYCGDDSIPKAIARCPTCGSGNIQRLPKGWKVTKVVALGIFGLGDVHKIFKCLNCGYKW